MSNRLTSSKRAIKNLGEFDKYTTTAFQEPEKVAYFVVDSNQPNNNLCPQYSLPRRAGLRVPKEETDLAKGTLKFANCIQRSFSKKANL